MNTKTPFIVPDLKLDDLKINITEVVPYLMTSYAKLQVFNTLLSNCRMDSRLLFSIFQTKEVLASTSLEGTQATIEDVYDYKMFSRPQARDEQEIINYFEALKFGQLYLQNDHIDLNFFNEIQRILLNGTARKNTEEIGKLRQNQNKVKSLETGQITYTPPVFSTVEKSMYNLIEYIDYEVDEYLELIRIAVIHAQFESIHPYMDGNGRVGRILIPLYLHYKKVIPTPYLYLSEMLKSGKLKYYSCLNGIRENDDWKEWIIFFLDVVDKQCDKYIAMIREMDSFYEKELQYFFNTFKHERGEKILNILIKNPVITSNKIMEQIGLPRNTVLRYLKILEEDGIIYSNENSRNTKYYYYGLLSLLQ